MIVDHTNKPSLLHKKRPWYWWIKYFNVWVWFQHAAYFVAPHNDCIYCWLGRMFVIGLLIGWHVTYWWMKK